MGGLVVRQELENMAKWGVGVIKFQTVKPAKFKGAVFTQAITKEMTAVKKDVLKDFSKTTNYWKNKPVFKATSEKKGDVFSVTVGTDSDIYRYVDEGTKPHTIVPVNARMLRWRGPFKAKTVPNRLESGRGNIGTLRFAAFVVHHPGTKARNFTTIIKWKWETAFKDRMQQAILNASKYCGNYAGW